MSRRYWREQEREYLISSLEENVSRIRKPKCEVEGCRSDVSHNLVPQPVDKNAPDEKRLCVKHHHEFDMWYYSFIRREYPVQPASYRPKKHRRRDEGQLED